MSRIVITGSIPAVVNDQSGHKRPQFMVTMTTDRSWRFCLFPQPHTMSVFFVAPRCQLGLASKSCRKDLVITCNHLYRFKEINIISSSTSLPNLDCCCCGPRWRTVLTGAREHGLCGHAHARHWREISYDTIRYDTIRDAILTCARKPT